jgi:hypothetical protein
MPASAGLMAPDPIAMAVAQREVIAPPWDVDRGMTIKPPQSGARMPVIQPDMPGDRYGIER